MRRRQPARVGQSADAPTPHIRLSSGYGRLFARVRAFALGQLVAFGIALARETCGGSRTGVHLAFARLVRRGEIVRVSRERWAQTGVVAPDDPAPRKPGRKPRPIVPPAPTGPEATWRRLMGAQRFEDVAFRRMGVGLACFSAIART